MQQIDFKALSNFAQINILDQAESQKKENLLVLFDIELKN